MASEYRYTQLLGEHRKPTCSPCRLQSKQFMEVGGHSLPISPDEKFPVSNDPKVTMPSSSQCEPGNGKVVGPSSTSQVPEFNRPSQIRQGRAQQQVLGWQHLGKMQKSCSDGSRGKGFRIHHHTPPGAEWIPSELPQSRGSICWVLQRGPPVPDSDSYTRSPASLFCKTAAG